MLRRSIIQSCNIVNSQYHKQSLSNPSSSSSSLHILRAMSTTTTANSSNTLKPWPYPMVESHGDYRAEAYLEDHIGGKLYSKQHSLPRLPIPSISDTINRFLPTALPLAKNEEEKTSLIQACEEFEGQAVELQQRLIERKEGEMKDSSWLQLWWNTMGYLQVRVSICYYLSCTSIYN